MPYAIRRVFDGKLLPLPNVNRRRGMTWCEFDDDVFNQNKEMIPALWPSKAGAVTTAKMWSKGGWRRDRGKIVCVHQPDRDQYPIEVVAVQIVPVPVEPSEQQLEAETRSRNSVLD